jgi:hypothetical protein
VLLLLRPCLCELFFRLFMMVIGLSAAHTKHPADLY